MIDIDKIYVINLERSKDRKYSIIKELKKLNIDNYIIWSAVDGKKENVEYVIDDNNKSMEGWNIASAGLVYTTISIIEDAKKNGYESILIIEDDVIIDSNVIDFSIRGFKTKLSDWQLFHFSTSHFVKPLSFNKFNDIILGAWSCQMYAINSNIYDLYLDNLKKVNLPIDAITSSIIHPQRRSYSLKNDLVITEPNISTIRDKYINHSEFVIDKKNIKPIFDKDILNTTLINRINDIKKRSSSSWFRRRKRKKK